MITKNKLFSAIQTIILVLSCFVVIVPFLLLVVSSITPEEVLIKSGFSLIPRNATFEAYKYLLVTTKDVERAYMMSILIAFVGVSTNLLLTILYAYPLSRRDLRGRTFFAFFLFFTMLFNGGLVPTFLVYTRIFNIEDTFLAMVVPGLLMNGFNVILMRTYITSNIGTEIIDAVSIDGAGDFRCLATIVVPICKPIIGTLGIMTFTAYWNNWTNGIYYIRKRHDLWGIQNYMKSILDSVSALQQQIARALGQEAAEVPSISLRMALAVLALIPVLITYLFFQKSFVKGITIGSVKG
jgi:putative aldouronate transport system permease protein